MSTEWAPNDHRGQSPNDGKWAHDMPKSSNADEVHCDKAQREKDAWLAGLTVEAEEYQAEVDATSAATKTRAAAMQAEAIAVGERSMAYLKSR